MQLWRTSFKSSGQKKFHIFGIVLASKCETFFGHWVWNWYCTLLYKHEHWRNKDWYYFFWIRPVKHKKNNISSHCAVCNNFIELLHKWNMYLFWVKVTRKYCTIHFVLWTCKRAAVLDMFLISVYVYVTGRFWGGWFSGFRTGGTGGH